MGCPVAGTTRAVSRSNVCARDPVRYRRSYPGVTTRPVTPTFSASWAARRSRSA
ncbi:Uncharacterised protein [Mycobacteroides abscessus subsp. abscessus]|nr:Uncharacterised protein [Mycobacteroides abscessus subsp. abscessus]SIN46288.1 Uncharacterised protein [Mycobacteroides abscessus subsp. abscessus]